MRFLVRLAVALCGLLTVGSSFAVTQDFPTSYSWTSTGPLISPKPDATHDPVSVKNPSAVYYNGQYIVYTSYITKTGGFGLEYWHFTNWSDAGAATPYYLDGTAIGGGYHSAPQVFYFAPKNTWYLIYQSPQPQYSTNSDPTQPQNWTAPKNFFATQPPGTSGWLDYWIICDSANCYLFFCDDGGKLFRSSTPIGDFPNGFNDPVVVYSEANSGNLFEAENVYTVEGTGEYLANVECIGTGGHRFFRALWATSLNGAWTPLGNTLNFSTPFLGMDNVTFDAGVGQWTDDFSSGGAVIDGNDQTDSINLNNLTFLYQGVNPNSGATSYGQIPYQLGLATSNANTTGCTPTAINPQINVGGIWTGESSVTVTSASTVVDLGPQPLTGGSWSWTGPNGFTSTAREIDSIELTAGTNVYTATYTNDCGSKSTQAFTITVGNGSFTLAASASRLSVAQGVSATDTVTVTDAGGFTGNVTLAASGLPSGVTAAFATNPTTSTSVLTLKASSSATAGTSTVTITGTSGSLSATKTIALTVTSSSTLIANGTYIITAVNSGSAIDDPGSSKTNGLDMQIYTANDGTNQQWTVNNVGNNVITLTNVASGQALDVSGDSKASGALVDQWPANGATNQEWNVISVAGGAFELTSVNSGLALSVVGGGTANGTGVDQLTYSGSTSQQWKFTSN